LDSKKESDSHVTTNANEENMGVTLPPQLLSPNGCRTDRSVAILKKAKEKTTPATFHRLLSLFCDILQKMPHLNLSAVTLDDLVNIQLQESGLSSVDLVNLKESMCSSMNIYLAGRMIVPVTLFCLLTE
jgi:hypothetical protein